MKYAFLRFAAWPLCLALSLLWAVAADAQSLVVNTSQTAPRSTVEGLGFQDELLKLAFARCALRLKILHLPSERAIVNANEGIDDGNLARIAGMESQYPNLIRVPESITAFNYLAFSRIGSLDTHDFKVLKPYRIGIITGWKVLEENFQDAPFIVRAKDERALFELLGSGRVDLVIFEALQGRELLKQMGLYEVTVIEQPLLQAQMYLYLHKRHAELAPRLAAALRGMKEDGSFEKIVYNVLFGSNSND